MSKYTKFIVATLAAMAMATPAFAITADMTGFLQIRGIASENLQDGDDSINDKDRFVDQRFRLFTNAALSENVKAVFGIEVDNVWGSTADAADGNLGKVGADAKSQIEIKHLYLDFNVPGANTNVKAGTQYFKHGGGFIIAEDATGLQARYTPVKGQSVLFSWIKAVENTAERSKDDTDYYHLQYDADVAGWRLSPFVAFLNGAPTGNNLPATSVDFEAWYAGIEANGKVGPVALAATAIYNDWEDDGIDEDNTAYALWAKATYVTGGTTLSVEGARYGDDEAGPFVSVRGYNNFAEVITGGMFDSRNTGFPGSQQFAGGGNASYYMNFLYGKLAVDQKLNDKAKISGAYIYAEEAEDTTTRDKATFGHEIDAYFDYIVTKGLTFTVGGGYLIADDDIEDEIGKTDSDDVWKLGTALTYKF